MTDSEQKSDLHRYLKNAREAMVWKLDGLSEYDARRPLTPTGTNLLGLVKHLALVEMGYFGDTFGRPFPDPPEWAKWDEDDLNADMWATPDQSREDIVGLYRRVWVHADGTISELALDAEGRVPWWGDRGDVTLHLILIHMIAETDRHAGHADIVRELIDGAAGLRNGNDNLPGIDKASWESYHAKVEAAAREAGG
ncbi:MAG: DinB family protein [Streptosporangiaceae bacterium]